ncbi:MAG: hypothetical protein ABW174_15820 [Flavitalea sp.]
MNTPGFLLFAALVVSAASCTPGTGNNQIGSPPASDSASVSKPVRAEELIIPGRSIGMTALGETSESVHKRMGAPDLGDAAMGKSTAEWYANHDTTSFVTQVYFSRSDDDEVKRAKQIRITSSFFKLGDGSSVGTPFLKIAGLYSPKKVATFTDRGSFRVLYDDAQTGIAFETDTATVIRGITIHEPGKEVTATYLPFFPDIKHQ